MDGVKGHLGVVPRLLDVYEQQIVGKAYRMAKQEVVEPAAANSPKLLGRLRSPCQALEHSRCSSSEVNSGAGWKKLQEFSSGTFWYILVYLGAKSGRGNG
jgi:hypothetical protein